MGLAGSPNYTFKNPYVFPFEGSFDHISQRQWMVENWHTVFYYIGAYVVIVFGGQFLMSHRPRFDLRHALAAWNVTLSAFSTFGFFRVFPEFQFVLKEFGLQYSVCNPSNVEDNKVTGFWTWMFVLSKVPELGDTFFIVLRKQRLIFLHWYHHISVVLYCWYTYQEHTAMVRWFIWMNYLVHSGMYLYFALRALKIRLPLAVSIFITCSQILQMIIACVISAFVFLTKMRREACNVTLSTSVITFWMYFSFLVLFLKFFYNTYMAKSLDMSNGQCKKLQ